MAKKKIASKQVLKAFSTVVNGQQQQKKKSILLLEKLPLEQDEFTEHQSIKVMILDWVNEAIGLEQNYQANKKNMIRTVALRMAEELTRLGKSELICRISEELINILKQVGIKWNPIYVRRCLDERYKNPDKRASALARKQNPGVPQDSNRSKEELLKALEPSKIGEYVICTMLVHKHSMNDKGNTPRWLVKYDASGTHRIYTMPVIVKCNPSEREATVEFDMKAYQESMK